MEETTRNKLNLRPDSQAQPIHYLAPDEEMKRGLLTVSRQPARLCDVENFKTLHNPRVHGMTEWLLQYESACRRQEIYLQQLKELRQQFQSPTRTRDHISRSDEVTTDIQSFFWKSGIPVSSLTKPSPSKESAPPPSKPRKLTQEPQKRVQARDCPKPDPGFLVTPKCVHAAMLSLMSAKQPVALPPLDDADRRTDYEPIDSIARRNKLHLSKYLSVGSG